MQETDLFSLILNIILFAVQGFNRVTRVGATSLYMSDCDFQTSIGNHGISWILICLEDGSEVVLTILSHFEYSQTTNIVRARLDELILQFITSYLFNLVRKRTAVLRNV